MSQVHSTKSVSRMDELLCAWRAGYDHPMRLRLHRLALRYFRSNRALVNTRFGSFFVDQTDYIGSELINRGVYEPNTLALCAKIMESGGVFIDVGANLGLHTIAVSANKAVRTVAIEPDAQNLLSLLRNVKLNVRSNVDVCNCAVGSCNSISNLILPYEGNRGSVRVADNAHLAGSSDGWSVSVAVTTLGQICEKYNIGRIDLIKIDVEGSELEVLQGLRSGVDPRPLHIVVEFNCPEVSSAVQDLRESALYLNLVRQGYVGYTVVGEPLTEATLLPEANAWFRLGNTVE